MSQNNDLTAIDRFTIFEYLNSYCDVWHFRSDKIVELRAFVIKT